MKSSKLFKIVVRRMVLSSLCFKYKGSTTLISTFKEIIRFSIYYIIKYKYLNNSPALKVWGIINNTSSITLPRVWAAGEDPKYMQEVTNPTLSLFPQWVDE
jgi:hypothetical protein